MYVSINVYVQEILFMHLVGTPLVRVRSDRAYLSICVMILFAELVFNAWNNIGVQRKATRR